MICFLLYSAVYYEQAIGPMKQVEEHETCDKLFSLHSTNRLATIAAVFALVLVTLVARQGYCASRLILHRFSFCRQFKTPVNRKRSSKEGRYHVEFYGNSDVWNGTIRTTFEEARYEPKCCDRLRRHEHLTKTTLANSL